MRGLGDKNRIFAVHDVGLSGEGIRAEDPPRGDCVTVLDDGHETDSCPI